MEGHNKPQRPTPLLRAAQGLLASAAFALLAACGGGGDGGSSSSSTPAGGVSLKVVSFGDSLSDVGTYSDYVLPNFGGGRFTTNPGDVWTQVVATYYGDNLTPAVTGGFGTTTTAKGGLGYAQGGARVALQPGSSYPTLTTVPVATQVQNYLTQYGSFNSGQLVLVQGGANDVILAAQTIAANPSTASQQAANVVTAATALAGVVGTVLSNGATKVVVVNVPDIGKTPAGLASSDGGTLLTTLSGAFNTALSAALNAGGLMSKVIFVDSFTFIDNVVTNYAANGFSVSNTGTGCNLTLMQTRATAYATANPSAVPAGETPAQFGASLASSLFCSRDVYTVAGADQSYMFADSIHPTTHLHALFAQQVEQKVAAAGIGH
ncbi:SGNH/GDSL hydrolase family protein [Trinickia caryophylli]|uniref:Phospholipase/lecithinase/hemolysin n=2 Tax=Trinickia caryophylli TaxID=28094 RepID=A0A1X7EYD5_TRICW|nr:SGNH/GDSL hydrolase family protein [Trinickia caryophylli]WQE10776.1 SGNH/GDSL hydrolase family protein [Trinickia caryophylli]GLU33151.1 acylhydrolase [Trinickia caryophylli]SMF41957.1 Phospholipase/lecithinase/hemolysin [Trinickia caryophylli]